MMTSPMTHGAAPSRRTRRPAPRSQLVMMLSPHVPQVHRFSADDDGRILHFLTEDSGNSALICGDAGSVLSQLPGGTFQTCVTSPPYWSLRDYSKPGQIGLEESVHAYVDHLTRIFG